jgi:hypothetical protein
MELKVITKDGNKHLRKLKIGDLVLCDDGNFYPIKHVAVMVDTGFFIRFSNNISFNTHSRLRIKSVSGFKFPELWDSVYITRRLQPMVTQLKIRTTLKFFYDIMIDGNMVSPDGIVFRFGD